MPGKRNRALTSVVKVRAPLSLSLEEIQTLTEHPQIEIASKKLRKALEAITGWRMISKRGIPRREFRLAAAYEDALRQVEEAFIAATRESFLRRPCPHCGLRPRRINSNGRGRVKKS